MTTLDHRRSGILLHPTSLPGPHGSGDFGPAAFHFIDWLVAAGQSVWQVLPLNPIGPGHSPYASVSAFAGNPLLVALEPLIEAGWLAAPEPGELAQFSPQRVDFERVIDWRMGRLRAACGAFFAHATGAARANFDAYCASHAAWLDDYALFMALDVQHRSNGTGIDWPDWDPALARRAPAALAAARMRLATELDFWRFVQHCFDRQWHEVKRYANQRGVQIAGDLPIFVAHHSADCWSRPDLYLLDDKLQPKVVAGVPPDFFSATGQRWGNPLYDWDAMRRDGYAWWIARARRQLALADLVRIDHFRGFAAYWEIAADCPTAIDGRWVAAPGAELFEALARALPDLPVIAEDLGVITPDVETLRDRFGLPGMKILQFGFSGDANHAFLPHNYVSNCVAYTGTHDNDTVRGWFASATDRERRYALAYLPCAADDLHWGMIQALTASVARLTVIQWQDVLGLDGAHRMNTPGRSGCWTWRFAWEQVPPAAAQRMSTLCATYGRAPFGLLAGA